MPNTTTLARVALSAVLATVFLSVTGCGGGGGSAAEDPEVANKRQQARISAYGKSGLPDTTSKGGNVNPQAAARRRGR